MVFVNKTYDMVVNTWYLVLSFTNFTEGRLKIYIPGTYQVYIAFVREDRSRRDIQKKKS